MFIVKLEEKDINNLKIFLSRTQLTGQEVPAYSKILQALYEAEEIKEKPKKVGE